MEWLPRMIIVMGHVRWAFHGFSVLSAKDYWLLHFIFTAKRSKRLYWETLFNGITLYLPSLSEFNYDSFSFFLSISVLFLGLFGKIEFIHAHHSCFNLFSSVYRMRFPSFFFLSKITIMKFEFKSGVIIMMNNYPYNV